MLVVILIILTTIALFLMSINKKKDNFIFFKPLNEKGTEIKLINNKFINNSLNITVQKIAPFKKVLIHKRSNKAPVKNPVNISKDPMLKSNRKY